MRSDRRRSLALASGLLLAALGQYTWNLATLPPFSGYDDDGHMHYVATLLDEGRLPHPTEGWSTFHPPLYHALVALLSARSTPIWNPFRIGLLSALSILVAGAAAFFVIRALGYGRGVAAVATALLLFTPCVQLAATMVGNEALCAAFCALALAGLVGLQSNPRNLRLAAGVGVAVGLALATKWSGGIVALACAAPFLRRDFDRRCLRAAALCGGITILLGSPTYLRNLAYTGTPLPGIHHFPLVAQNEQKLAIRERRVGDYLWIDPAVFANPLVPDPAGAGGLNPAMTNVWGLAYASTWFDAHALRVARIDRDTAVLAGRWLLALGLLPTSLLLIGCGLALRDLVRGGSATRDAPLLLASAAGLAGFVLYSTHSGTTAAVKGAYLLPLALPAAVFFSRGVTAFPKSSRGILLLGSAVAGIASAVLWTNGVLLPRHADRDDAALPRPLAAVAAELDASSAGRWRGIRFETAPDGTLAWELEAFAYSPVNPAQLSVWCGYVARAMGRHLPGRGWQARVTQGTRRGALRCRDQDGGGGPASNASARALP